MGLLRDIQNGAIDDSVDLAVVLRKCKVLAARLNHREFADWVEKELNGYGEDEELPTYRIHSVQAYGDFSGAFGRELNSAPIPSSILPESIRDLACEHKLREGIGSYTPLVQPGEAKTLRMRWSGDIIASIARKVYRDMSCVSAWSEMSTHQMKGFLDTIRNKVLSFILEIEKQNPDAGEAAPNTTPIPLDKVTQIFHTQIYGDVGNLASGSHQVHQVNVNVTHNDLESLKRYLKTVAVPDEAISTLEVAIKKDGDLGDKKELGVRVKDWIADISTKVGMGTISLGKQVGIGLIVEAILMYYGLK